MRVAVTTNDLQHVDVSFGLAEHIAIYEVNRRGTRLVETYHFPGRTPGCDNKGLSQRAAALKNCTLLYTVEIGNAASARTYANGVLCVRVGRPRAIRDVLSTLSVDLEAMRPWFRSILVPKKNRTITPEDSQ